MLNQLQDYKSNLESELQTVQLCHQKINLQNNYDGNEGEQMADLPQQTKEKVVLLLEEMQDKITEEIEQISKTQRQFNKQNGIEASDQEHFNLIQLRYNKIILQVEKIYACTPQFQEISNQVPFRQEKFGLLSSDKKENQFENREFSSKANGNYNSLPTQQSKYQQQYSPNKGKKMNCQNSSVFKPPFSPPGKHILHTKLGHIDQNLDYTKIRCCNNNNKTQSSFNNGKTTFTNLKGEGGNHRGYLEKELQKVKQQFKDIGRELKDHHHQTYEAQIQELKEGNDRIQRDCLMLKQDTQEMIFSISEIMRMAQTIKSQNEEMLQQLNHLKSTQANVLQFSQTERNIKPNIQQTSQHQEIISRKQSQHNQSTASHYNNKNIIENQQQINKNQQSRDNSPNQQINKSVNSTKGIAMQDVDSDQEQIIDYLNRKYADGEGDGEENIDNSQNNQNEQFSENSDNSNLNELEQNKGINRSLIPQPQVTENDVELLASWAQKKL